MNKVLYTVILLVTFAVSGCKESEVIPPDDLIGKEQMIEILVDVCKIEARFQRRMSLNGRSPLEISTSNYAMVLDSHNVSLNQFRSSYEYYEHDPEQMREFFDEVIIVLKKEQSLLLEGNQKQTEE